MPWVRFTERFKWSPPKLNHTWTAAYPAGFVGNVTTPCAKAAIAAGKAVPVKRRRKTDGAEG